MTTWRVLLAAAAASIGFAAAPAAAQNLVLNPSFESADTTSWTITGTCPFDVLSPPGTTTTGAGGFPVQAPTQGAFILLSDAVAPGTCTLFQDIALPAGQNFILSFGAGYNYEDFGDPTGAGCDASIGLTTVANVPIATFYTRSGGIDQSVGSRGPFNLGPGLAGTTVRLTITTNSCVGGPAGIVADNFVLVAGATTSAVPTLSEWATLLLALLMAMTAFAGLRRIRQP